jgi:hypothetical protein
MEDLLNTHHALEDCYKKYSLDDIRQMSMDQLKAICLEERIAHAKNIKKLNAKELIKERIDVLKEQYETRKATRREELKNYFKY